jgi:hypothetical protein
VALLLGRLLIVTESRDCGGDEVGRQFANSEAMLRRLTDFVLEESRRAGPDALPAETVQRLRDVAERLLADIEAMVRRLTDLAIREGRRDESVPMTSDTLQRLRDLLERLRVAFDEASIRRTE